MNYEKINWKPKKEGGTPLNADNLNVMDDAISECVDEINKSQQAGYLTCDTSVSDVNKVVNFDGFVLGSGVKIIVRFTDTTTDSKPTSGNMTLNVNGTGAKPIVDGHGNKTIFTYTNYGMFWNNYVCEFVYDGTYWVYLNRDYNSTYTNMTLGNGYGTCSTDAATTAKVATLSDYNLVVGGYISIKFTYDVPANATLNVNDRGAKNIFYKGSKIVADVIKAGDLVTFIYDGTQYVITSIDRWNSGLGNLINDKTASTNSTYSSSKIEELVDDITPGTDITENEYENLPDTKLSDNVVYFVTDGEDSIQNDSNIIHDPDTSESTHNVVEGLKNRMSTCEQNISSLNSNISNIKLVNITSVHTASGVTSNIKLPDFRDYALILFITGYLGNGCINSTFIPSTRLVKSLKGNNINLDQAAIYYVSGDDFSITTNNNYYVDIYGLKLN